MELKTYTVQDANGAIVPNASVRLLAYPSGLLADPVYDANGNKLTNPFKANADGIASFAAADGEYTVIFGIGPLYGPPIRIQFLDQREVLSQTESARDGAIAARQEMDTINNARTFTSISAGQAAVAVGDLYRVVGIATANYGFTYYLKTSEQGYTVLQSTPNQKSFNQLDAANRGKLDAYKFEDVIQTAKSGTGLIYCVRDRDGRQTWIGVSDVDGGPSPWAEQMIRQRLGMNKKDSFAAGEEELFFGIADSANRLTDLALRERDGQLADFVVERLAKRIGDKLGVTKDTIGQLLGSVHMTPDYPGFQLLASIARWSAQRYVVNGQTIGGSAITGPWNFGTTTYNQAARLTFTPTPYNKPDPLLLVLYVGGVNSGSDLTVPTWIQPLLAEGVVVGRCNYHGNHYGQPQAIQDMIEVYEMACKTLPIGGVLLLGNSMGGMLALNALTTRAIPGVCGLYLTDPVANLADRYESERKAMIQAAYGIDSNGSNYSAKTAGYDPMLRDWSDYRGIPIAITGSTGDDLVPFNQNGLKLYDKLSSHNDVTLYSLSSAGHNQTDRFNIDNLRAFIKKCVQGSILKA